MTALKEYTIQQLAVTCRNNVRQQSHIYIAAATPYKTREPHTRKQL